VCYRGAAPESSQRCRPRPHVWMAAASGVARNETAVDGCTISVRAIRRALRPGHAPVLNTLNTPPPVERAKRSPLGLKPQRPAEGAHGGQRENNRIQHPCPTRIVSVRRGVGCGPLRTVHVVVASAVRPPNNATPPPPRTVGERDTRSPVNVAPSGRGVMPRGRTILMVAARVAALRSPGEHRTRRAPPTTTVASPPARCNVRGFGDKLP